MKMNKENLIKAYRAQTAAEQARIEKELDNGTYEFSEPHKVVPSTQERLRAVVATYDCSRDD